jgi:hypothetical protein
MVDSDTQLLTADDLLGLPRGMGERYELVEGRLMTMAPAGFEHGNISARGRQRPHSNVGDGLPYSAR